MRNSLLIVYVVDKAEKIARFLKTNLPQQRGAVYGIPPIESEDYPFNPREDKRDRVYRTKRRNK